MVIINTIGAISALWLIVESDYRWVPFWTIMFFLNILMIVLNLV